MDHRPKTTDRAREGFSLALSTGLHLALVLAVAPCVPAVSEQLVVYRIRLEPLEPAPELLANRAEASDRDRDDARSRPEPDEALSEADPSPPEPMEPEPPDEPEPMRDAVEVVHTEAPGERPEDALAESRFDRDSPERRHAPITAAEEGPDTSESLDATARRLASGEAGRPREDRASAGAAASAPAPPPRGGLSATSEGVPQDPSAADPWTAQVARSRPGAAREAEAPEDAPDPEATEPEERDRTDPIRDPATAEGEAGRLRSEESERDPGPAAPPPADPSSDPADAVADAAVPGEPRAGDLPTLDAERRVATSHQAVVDAPKGDPQLDAIATERGAWIQRVDDAIRARWAQLPLPAHLVAIGVRGTATVRFSIDPQGRTSEPRLVRKSGNEWLDALALDAIPDRVPRMPRTLPQAPVQHEITFRYR